MGWAAEEQEIVLYAYGVRISERNPIWVQGMFTTLMQVFEWLIL